MKKFVIPLLTVAMVVILIATGCRPKPPERPAYPEEMPCGMVVDLSGPHADMGKKLSAGAEAAVDQMNAWGGVRNMYSMKLDLIVADDGGSPEQAAAEAERLITEEKVIFVIGAWPTAVAVSEVCEEHETPFISTIGVDPLLTGRGYYYTFRFIGSASDVASQLVNAMTKFAEEAGRPQPKTCFMEYVSDAPAVAVAEAFKPLAENAGIDIVGDEAVEATATTFVPLLEKIEAAKPDVLFSCHYTDDAIILYQEMMDRQTYFPYGIFSWGGGLEDSRFYETLPQRAYEYGFTYETGDPLPQKRGSSYNWVNAEVKAKLGDDWKDYFVGTAYTAVWVAKEGLERMAPPQWVSIPGQQAFVYTTGGGKQEFSLDIVVFRSNLRYSLSAMDVTRADSMKLQLPDATVFLPPLQTMGYYEIKFDDTGQNIYGAGMVSQNIGGTRWPLYPEANRPSDSPSVVLPIPPWSER
jgi:branched-chain amino acid transport system substrate-binding protein